MLNSPGKRVQLLKPLQEIVDWVVSTTITDFGHLGRKTGSGPKITFLTVVQRQLAKNRCATSLICLLPDYGEKKMVGIFDGVLWILPTRSESGA